MSSPPSALRQLEKLADARKRERYPNVPEHGLVKARYSDKTANDLTRAIVDCFTLSGHFATRLQSTGTYREDLKRYVPSQQRRGLPDVFAVVHVEVKIGRDRLSSEQQQAIEELQAAGAAVFIAPDFQTFYQWFLTEFSTSHEPV
jgi:VRR-NUC domain